MSGVRLTFEQFAARHGASQHDVGDAGGHRASERMSEKMWQRTLAPQRARDVQWQAKREELRDVYATAVHNGEIEPPSYLDRTLATANGHPDLQSTQAARRILLKRFGLDHTGLPTQVAAHPRPVQSEGVAA